MNFAARSVLRGSFRVTNKVCAPISSKIPTFATASTTSTSSSKPNVSSSTSSTSSSKSIPMSSFTNKTSVNFNNKTSTIGFGIIDFIAYTDDDGV